MKNFLVDIVKALFDQARLYLKATPSPFDDILIGMLNAIEKFILDKIVPLPAVQKAAAAVMSSHNMSALTCDE